MNQSANDLLMGGSTPAAKFETIGTIVKGEVVEMDTGQQRDFVTKEPLWWQPNRRPGTAVTNDPVMQPIFTLQTDERDPEIDGDDGRRRLYAGSLNLRRTLQDAVRNAGANSVDLGGQIAVQYTGGSGNTGDPKQYKAEYRPPAPGAAANSLLGAAAPADGNDTSPF